jgi:ribosomal protein S18 acetylase RimI-like enzyme
MEIKLAEMSDIFEISKCQQKAFPNSLSSKLGIKFIQKMLSWYIADERGILFFIQDENNVVLGYCGGIITKNESETGAATSITQYGFNVFLWSILRKPWLIFHKELLAKTPFLLRNILVKLGFSKIKKIGKVNDQKFRSRWGLVVIGVNPDFRGGGIGTKLLLEFERLASLDKVCEITLSVKRTNKNAIAVYKKNNWKIYSSDSNSYSMKKELKFCS